MQVKRLVDRANCDDLSHAQMAFLQECVKLGTPSRKILAEHLCLSKGAIHSRFKRIGAVLGTSGAAEAILYYTQHCCQITLPPLPPPGCSKKRIKSAISNTPNWGFQNNGRMHYNEAMLKNEDMDAYIDQVAQAVIDRIEERDRVTGLVEMVVQRVLQLQQENKDEAALIAAVQAGEVSSTDPREP